jgi:hypothetical protein
MINGMDVFSSYGGICVALAPVFGTCFVLRLSDILAPFSCRESLMPQPDVVW